MILICDTIIVNVLERYTLQCYINHQQIKFYSYTDQCFYSQLNG